MKRYTLNNVIKAFKKVIAATPEEDILIREYYNIIVRFLLLENKYPAEVNACNKNILHYFVHHLPVEGREYFNWLYSGYNPVRFSVETFDSVPEVRAELRGE